MKYLKEKHLRSLTTCLYFLCFLVTNGKGECPKPQGKNNMVLTDESLLMNDFPEGSTAEFECSNGYVKEQGSGTILCTSGAWSEPQMTCQKKDCGIPKKIRHMNYEISEGTLFGAKMRQFCDEGYQLEGTSYRHCYATGWSGRARCEEIICNKPTEIKNGKIVTSHTGDVTYLQVVEYSCDEGYTLVGNNSVFCNGDGDFSSLPPKCEVKTCPSLDIPFSVPLQGGPPFLYKDIVSVTCEDGYSLQGSAQLQCEQHGWSSPSPRCIRESSSIGTTEAATSTNSKFPSETSSKAPPAFSPTRIQGKHETMDKKKEDGMPARNSRYTVVIISVVSTVIIAVILLYILHLFVKRKGSYHTGEDSKEDLVQFHYYKYTPRNPVGCVGRGRDQMNQPL